MQGAVVADLPVLTFAIAMQANRMYVIEWEQTVHTGTGGSIELSGKELDATGEVIARLTPATNEEVEACREHTP